MSYTFIRCKDAYSSNYRYIESDIAPLVGSEMPYVATSSYSIFSSGSYYQSAVFGAHDYIYIFALFDSEPTIIQNTLGHNLSRGVFYDDTSGLWVLMASASFGLKEHWTDRSAPITSDCEFFNYSNYSTLAQTQTAFLDYIKTEYTPAYTWQSVASISGKNGILPLTMLKSELITGDTQQNLSASDFTQITGESRVEQIIANNTLPIGQSVPIIYSGLVDNLSLERYSNDTYYLRLYYAGQSGFIPYMNCMYNYPSSYRHYLAFIIDDENQVAKYVNVIEDNGSYTFDAMPWTDEQMSL